ncbi:MAG: GDP-mannose 4,6-dehydratase, partial [Alphaproteobacteria bacterium]
LIAIPYSYRSPAAYVETNITGTLNILQAAREFGVRRVVHTSTSETYGTAQFVPITELHPQVGQSPYAATKIAADQMALSFHRSFDLPVTVLRPFNTYGPRQSARAVIPTIIAQSLSGDGQIRLGSRHPTRDFTLVHDTVGGFVAMLEATQPVEGEVVNIGSGFEISIGETADVIAQAVGRDLDIVFDEERVRPRNSEVERLWAGTDKAKQLVGWQPSYAGLDGFRRGIAETVEWFRRGENLARYKSDIYNL